MINIWWQINTRLGSQQNHLGYIYNKNYLSTTFNSFFLLIIMASVAHFNLDNVGLWLKFQALMILGSPSLDQCNIHGSNSSARNGLWNSAVQIRKKANPVHLDETSFGLWSDFNPLTLLRIFDGRWIFPLISLVDNHHFCFVSCCFLPIDSYTLPKRHPVWRYSRQLL